MKKQILLILVLLLAGGACKEFPRDTENSFERAKANGLQVGVVINPPFTQLGNNRYSGTEINLIREFARRNQLSVEFHRDNESDLLKKLQKYELHIIAGGFDKTTLWDRKAGLSSPYNQQHVFLIPQGENRLLFELEKFLFEHVE